VLWHKETVKGTSIRNTWCCDSKNQGDFETEPPGFMTQRRSNRDFEKELLVLWHKQVFLDKSREGTLVMTQRCKAGDFEKGPFVLWHKEPKNESSRRNPCCFNRKKQW
jgi:hypothetical protein